MISDTVLETLKAEAHRAANAALAARETDAPGMVEAVAYAIYIASCDAFSMGQATGDIERADAAGWVAPKYLQEAVDERLQEIDAEAQAYDRDATKALTKLASRTPGFDWRDHEEGLTIEDCIDIIREHECETINSYERQRCAFEAKIAASIPKTLVREYLDATSAWRAAHTGSEWTGKKPPSCTSAEATRMLVSQEALFEALKD